jgi:hypothetical protein
VLARSEWYPRSHARGNGRQLFRVRHQGIGEQQYTQTIGHETDEQCCVGRQQQHCGWLQRRSTSYTGQI